ncbi:3-ketoacyl-CoA synthase 9 [Vitis vinifera]|uniref:3-ketoacyl-CoA synthase 9 n=1 Tax=Vitis vinifera TaxID=29760 RepID=A0A438FUZ8_VITVI|nr:3-ketoacyl-CoA synthase 9 [Vitis vinifera]
MDHLRLIGDFTKSTLEFQRKILECSSFGKKTYVLQAMHCLPCASQCWRPERRLNICSWFNPTPSFSTMIVNKCKFRGNIRSFNLGGMGCSARVITIDLARDLLQVYRNTYAVVVSTKNITQNWSKDKRRTKYELVHVLRTHRGANEKAFSCVYQK